MFFIATADAQGRPDCSYKGGLPGFVRVLDDNTLAIPDYDGNGMYRTWGNVLVNPHVGLLFLDFENPKRLRVNGTARVSADDPLRAEYPGAVFIVRVTAARIFPNCPRYLHKMQMVEHSVYAPRPDYSRGYVWPIYDAYDIYRAAADGSGLKALTTTPGYDAEATIAPDGRIAFTSVRDGDMEIYSMNGDGSDVRRLLRRRGLASRAGRDRIDRHKRKSRVRQGSPCPG